MGEAPFRVTSLRASEPNVAGKETLVEDLLCAKHCALLLPCRDDFYTLPEAARALSSLTL